MNTDSQGVRSSIRECGDSKELLKERPTLFVIFAGGVTCAGASARGWSGWRWQPKVQHICSSSQAPCEVFINLPVVYISLV